MKVAVAIISDEEDRILITQRPLHASHGGFWEFPGGKLESGELPEEALVREIKEELGIQVNTFRYLDTISYQYPEYKVHLHVFHVTGYSGEPACLEGQPGLRWVYLNQLNPEDFPEANHKVIGMLLSKETMPCVSTLP